MKIAVASDHAGFQLKNQLRDRIAALGYQVEDLGPDSDARCDYPDFARPAAEAVAAGRADRAVLVCGSGIGMAMTANKVRGVRAVVAAVELQARLARAHNDANVLCIGQRLTTPTVAERLLEEFLQAEFEGGRHRARVAKIENT